MLWTLTTTLRRRMPNQLSLVNVQKENIPYMDM
jgi:hypothetical protein